MTPHARRSFNMKKLGDILDLRPEQDGIDIREVKKEKVRPEVSRQVKEHYVTSIKKTVLGKNMIFQRNVMGVMSLNRMK